MTDITEIRRQLVQQGNEQLAQRHPFFEVMHGKLKGKEDAPRIEDVPGAAAWAYEGLVSAGTFAHALAYTLRLLDQDAPEMAQKVAQVMEYVMDAGMEALEDVNDDLELTVSDAAMPGQAGPAAEVDSLSQKMIDGINSNPITRRAFTRLADAYADGAL